MRPFENDAASWDELLARSGRSALEQSWIYGEAVAAGRRWSTKRYVVRSGGEDRGLVQVSERVVLGALVLARLVRGPAWFEPDGYLADLPSLYGAIRADYRPRRLRPLLWTPELSESAESAALMRDLGLRPMVTGYNTAWLDLRPPEATLRAALHGKWRNGLKAAEAAGLEVACDEPDALDWLLDRHDRQRRRRRFVARDSAFVRALAEADRGAGSLCVLRARLDGRPISGALFIRHGASATYEIAWSGPEGRRFEAQSLVLWRALLELKRRGLTWLDLGGLNAASPGLARFKLGLGAEPVTLVGTYL